MHSRSAIRAWSLLLILRENIPLFTQADHSVALVPMGFSTSAWSRL